MKKAYCHVLETGEVYEGHWLVCIATIASEDRIGNDLAENKLREATIDTPLVYRGEEILSE